MKQYKTQKFFFLRMFIFFFSFLMMTSQAFGLDPKIPELTAKKLPPIIEPEINITTLPNGIKIYYLKDDELPVFKMTSYFEVGTLHETKDVRGITGLFTAAWRSGGTPTRTPDQVDTDLEFVAAEVSAGGGAELTNFKVVCLQKDVKQVLDIYYDIIKNPNFDHDRLEVIRKNTLDGINRRNEEPMDIVNREYLQSLYGQNSPFAWLSTPETISAITREKLIEFYQNSIAPNRMIVAATSPLDFQDFLKLLEPYIKDWNKKLNKKKLPDPLEKVWSPSVELIEKEGNQSSIAMGHFGEKRFNKDKYKLILADEVLGGSTFGSKLGNRIRTDLGLAYSIRSNFGFDRDYPPFTIVTQTKSESTVEAILEIKKILKDMVDLKNISAQELESARERILNRLVFEFDLPFNIVNMRLIYDYNGYPPKYITKFQKEIAAVTIDQVKEVLADYFFPDKLKIMIVGQKNKIKDVEKLAGIKEIPLDNE